MPISRHVARSNIWSTLQNWQNVPLSNTFKLHKVWLSKTVTTHEGSLQSKSLSLPDFTEALIYLFSVTKLIFRSFVL